MIPDGKKRNTACGGRGRKVVKARTMEKKRQRITKHKEANAEKKLSQRYSTQRQRKKIECIPPSVIY